MAQPDTTSSVTLRDYVNVIWLRKWLVVVVIVACTLTAFLVADSKTRMYQATALMMYQPPANVANPLGSSSTTDITGLALQVQSVVNTVNSPAVNGRAGDLLRQSDPSARGYTVTAAIIPPDSSSGSTVSDVVGVTAVSARPRVSAAAANAYAKSIIELRRESEQARLRASQDAIQSQMKQFDTNASKLSTDYLLLVQRLRDLQVAEATATGGFTIIQPATPPASPSSPKPIQSAVVGFGVGLFAGIALAFVVGQFDTRVRTHAQAGEILGLPVVGRVPRLPRRLLRDGTLVTLTEPEGNVAEALRVLRSNLDWARIDDGWKSLLVTSSRKGEGKTLTLCNLAVTLALAGKRVVVVDADLRDPQVHRAFSMPNETGLTTVIQGTLSLAAALRRFDLEQSNGSGATTPADAPAAAAGIRERRAGGPHVGAAAPEPRGGHRLPEAGDHAGTAGQRRCGLRPGRRAADPRRRRRGSARDVRRWPSLRGQHRRDSWADTRGRARGARPLALSQARGGRRRRASSTRRTTTATATAGVTTLDLAVAYATGR